MVKVMLLKIGEHGREDMKGFQINFYGVWESLHPKVKSAAIAIGGFFVASLLLFTSRKMYPDFDFGVTQTAVLTAFCGFLVSSAKDWMKGE